MICVSKEYESKTTMVQEQWLQIKTTFFFIGLNWFLVGGNKNLVGRGRMSKFLTGRGIPTIPPVGKTKYIYIHIYNFANRFLYTVKKLPVHHIHHVHVAKWPSYFCKIWALCVSQIYVVYIFTCLFNVHNEINLSRHEHV